MSQSADYDVVVVGAGMVGLTATCALAAHPWRIGVVEAAAVPPPIRPRDLDIRVSAVTRASQRIFDALGVWAEMAGRRVTPFRGLRVWDGTGSGAIHFDAADIGVDHLGNIVENRVIHDALYGAVSSHGNVVWHRPAQLESLRVQEHVAELGLSDGSSVTTRLLVGADGADSQVRTLSGLRVHGWSYGQQALVANVRTSQWHQETAWQVFLPTGPLAFLPLGEQHCSIVWSTSPSEAERLLALDEDGFLSELQCAFGTHLGRLLDVGPRGAFPLRMLHVPSYVTRRVALVGDAAHTIHPLAGQGVNLGLLDAAALCEVLGSPGAGGDPGRLLLLRRYERWRKADNLAMAAAMEAFHRLFRTRSPAVRWVRNLGLNLTDHADLVKALFMRHASGLSGDLPKLALAPAPGHG